MDERVSSMDEDQFEAIRRWGEGLQRSDSEEFSAAGKAIVLLTAEVDQLERELWNVKTLAADQAPGAETEDELTLEEDQEAGVHTTLRMRLRNAVGSLYTRPARH
jgi:hypothetical protein